MNEHSLQTLNPNADPPVILFGHGRSGTSILAALMREHLGIAFGTESQFIVSYYHRLHHFGSLENEGNLKRLVDSLLQERWFVRSHKFSAFKTNRREIISNVKVRTYEGVLDAIFSLFAAKLKMQRWGDKTPSYIHHMPIIYKLFPHAQYVYLVRDGRDVALSLRNTHFGPKNMFGAARDWRDTVKLGDAFAESLPASQLFSLKYEQLIADPVAVFKQLAAFLHVDADRERLHLDLERSLPEKVIRGNSEKWRMAFTQQQIASFDRIAFDELLKHGYEATVSRAAEPSSRVVEIYWELLSEVGKWRFKGYWQDNLYKLRVRARRVLKV